MFKLKKLNFKVISIYIITTFFLVPMCFQNYYKLLFVISFIYMNLIFILKQKDKIQLSYKNIIKINTIILLFLLASIISPYRITFTVSLYIFLIIASFCFLENDLEHMVSESVYDVIYIICLVSILIQMITGKSNVINGKIALSILGDKNYSGILMILFFMYCDKRKYFFGKIISVFIILIVESRASIIVLAIMLFIKIFKNVIFKILNKLKLDKIYKLFIIMSIFTIIFSYFWTFNVAINGVKEYQEGLNDGSNKMRFASNVYAIESLKNNKSLLLYGYDEDFDSVTGTDSENRDNHTRYLGARLVQPHNSILNIFIKSGAVFSIIYFYLLGKLIDKKYDRNNIEYILSYFISCLFLHRLLNGTFLILWALVLCIPVKEKNYFRKIELKRR